MQGSVVLSEHVQFFVRWESRVTRSVYERALGERFAELAPALRRYCGPIPTGRVGIAEGAYEAVGPRWRILRPILHALAARDVLFPERGTDVPLAVENRYDARGTLRAIRSFRLPGRERRMLDAMRVERGALVDRLGRRGGLEVVLDAQVVDGGLVLASRALAWHVGRRRVPLPPVASVEVRERVDDRTGLQHVDARVRAALVGEVFRYTGAFAYRVERDAAASAPGG
ncbi:DUF4166 domain-containing protein [Agrococcus sp. SL85]|uniref:DUF4166 domain-containing protein n=1 Tax=Agrococcus sp. SL85 TaxID=2995141 RepID=UPI00226C73B4|nr:DUF4166 domain-containing protein [Agrococcus sp. SL85]WAC67273.1 DUF4166 domain-containing protein [Agrococcus sp. SL85]